MRGYFPNRRNLSLVILEGGAHMAPVNHGYRKEDEMKEFLHDKVVSTLSENLQNLVINLFGVVDPNGVVTSEDGVDFSKPDFILSYKGQKRYVSMKSGGAEIVHTEQAKNFIPFLRSIGVSEDTLRTILLYQYGDGTVNGTGKQRMNNHQTFEWLSKRVEKANDELNKVEIIMKVCDRALFQGVTGDVPAADAIYHGDFKEGFVASRFQIETYLENKSFDWIENLHVGPLLIRPHARYAGTEIKNPWARHKVVLYWPKMKYDIKYISGHYNDYIPEKYLDIEGECEDCTEEMLKKPKKRLNINKIPKKGLFSWLRNSR